VLARSLLLSDLRLGPGANYGADYGADYGANYGAD
jgi:hypothetical protein